MEIKENTLPKILRRIATENPKIPAQYSKDKTGKFQEILYEEVFQNVKKFAGGLLALGVKRGDHIGLISDNRKEWFQADMGLMSIGAIDVPRGCDATEKDLAWVKTCTLNTIGKTSTTAPTENADASKEA